MNKSLVCVSFTIFSYFYAFHECAKVIVARFTFVNAIKTLLLFLPQLLDYLRDLPALLRNLFRDFFSVGGMVMIFRARVFVLFLLLALYIISPLDIIPEGVLGLLGLIDDLFIAFIICVYASVIYRQFIAARR